MGSSFPRWRNIRNDVLLWTRLWIWKSDTSGSQRISQSSRTNKQLANETITPPTLSNLQTLITPAPSPNLGDYTLSAVSMDKLRNELPEYYRQQRHLSTPNALAILLERAFFHLNSNYPIFHTPTTQVETFPTFLTLAVASLGALLSDDMETQQFGLTLHNYVRDFIFSVHLLLMETNWQPLLFSQNREIWVLQTMLLINITGNHLGKRLDHEMSDILQGTMITVSNFNSILIQARPSK
jgi:hypothetical protein